MKKLLIAIDPHPSGPYTQFLRIQKGLKKLGWEVIGLSLNRNDAPEGYINMNVLDFDHQKISTLLNELIIDNKIDVFLPLGYPAIHQVLPFLPKELRVVKRASGITYENVLINHRCANALIATTPRQKADLIKLGIEPDKITIIPNPTDMFAKAKKEKEVVIGYIGRISQPSKGVLFIPRIYKELKARGYNVKLKYVGGGPDLRTLKMLHWYELLRKQVHFTGLFDVDKIADFANDIDILLMPSKTEGFGIALIEGMALGAVPVVARIEGVTDWIVQDGKSGFVVERNATSFVDKLTLLLEDVNLRRQMSFSAIERVKEEFSTEVVAKKYVAFLNKVLSEEPVISTLEGLAHQVNEFNKPPRKVMINQKKKMTVPEFVKDIYKIYNLRKEEF